MTMNRLIHNAVRRDLGRLRGALDAFPAGDAARAKGLQAAYRNLHRELTRHHEGEDTHIWPMLTGFGADPALLCAMESEHHAMAEALSETATAIDRLASDPSAAAAGAAATQVATLTEVVDRHLLHEETDLEPVVLQHEDTPEWKAVEKKLRGGSIGDAGLFFAWLTDGMPSADRDFLKTLIPAPVTFLLPRLFGRAYARDVAPVWAG
jgi:hemerythrin-like domain-containing protein